MVSLDFVGINVPEIAFYVAVAHLPEQGHVGGHLAFVLIVDTAGVSTMYANDGGVILAV